MSLPHGSLRLDSIASTRQRISTLLIPPHPVIEGLRQHGECSFPLFSRRCVVSASLDWVRPLGDPHAWDMVRVLWMMLDVTGTACQADKEMGVNPMDVWKGLSYRITSGVKQVVGKQAAASCYCHSTHNNHFVLLRCFPFITRPELLHVCVSQPS